MQKNSHARLNINLYTNVQNFMEKMFDVVHFASDLHLNRFCLVRDFAYLKKQKMNTMLKLVS